MCVSGANLGPADSALYSHSLGPLSVTGLLQGDPVTPVTRGRGRDEPANLGAAAHTVASALGSLRHTGAVGLELAWVTC